MTQPFKPAAFALLLFLAACQDRPQPATQKVEKCRAEPPPEPVACTMEWKPVCGCDGQTYGNACQARAAGIRQFTPGACDGKAVN